MSNIHRCFVFTAGIVLGVTGIAKIISINGTQMIFLQIDPLFGISFRHLFLFAGVLELTIACLCLFTNKYKINTLLIAWISTSLIVYRTGLMAINWRHPCHCLGNLTDVLRIPPHAADKAMLIILAYLLLGSYVTLLWLWRKNQRLGDAG